MTSWANLRTAVHALDLDEPAWIDALFSESRALFDDGHGLFAYSYRIDPDATIRLGSVAGCTTAPGVWQTLVRWGADSQGTLARVYQTGAGALADWTRATRRAGGMLSELHVGLEAHGAGDVFTIVGHDQAGFGVFLTLPRPSRATAATAKQRRAYEHLAAELALASRLREHRRRTPSVQLSAAERKVAERLLAGARDKTIAHELGVALSTVSTLARRIREKLGCRPGGEQLLSTTDVPDAIQRRLALLERLSPSECDVAAALLTGASHAQIAERRRSSLRTVATQCAAVYRKCGVSGRRELAAALLSS